MVSDSVSKKFGIEKSIGKIWYRKKFWIRFCSDFGYRHTLFRAEGRGWKDCEDQNILDTFSAQLSIPASWWILLMISISPIEILFRYFLFCHQRLTLWYTHFANFQYHFQCGKIVLTSLRYDPALYLIILSLAHKESWMWSFGQLTNSHRPTFGKRGSFSNKGVGGRWINHCTLWWCTVVCIAM